MAFPKSVPTHWVVRSVASSGKNLWDLNPFEFGVFDEDTHSTLTPAQAQKRRRVYFAVGSPNIRQAKKGNKFDRISNQNNADVNFRTEIIPTNKVDIIRFQEPAKTENPNVYYLGYNGIDTCESFSFECGKTYQFHVMAKGRPVRSIFGHEMREVIELTTDCCDSCTQTACDAGEGCEKYIDRLVDAFNNSLWVSQFFTAEKVINCEPALPSLTTTSFNVFELTVCDNGDELALSDVQNAYPTLDVKVVARNAPFTTYQVIKTGGAPSAFTQSSIQLAECDVCPSGFTRTASGFAYIVEVDNANPEDALAAVQAVWATATSATLIKFEDGTAEYYVISSAALSNPASGVDAAIVLNLGLTQTRCAKTTPTSTSWVANGTKYKVQRDLCLTIVPENCDTNGDGAETLARMVTYYANNADVVSGSLALDDASTTCLLRFNISQYNNDFLEDGCDTYAVAKFDELATFDGHRWDVCPCEGWTTNGDGCPVPPTPTDRCCQCGIKFTGRSYVELVDRFQGYDINTYLEKDPVELAVTVYRTDDQTNICEYQNPTWLWAQRASFRQLRGDDVVKRIILDRYYGKEPWVNQIDKENQLFLQREGIKLGVNLDKFYFAIDVYFNEDKSQNNTASFSNTRNCVTLFVCEDDVITLDSLKATLAQCFDEAKLENY